MVAVPLALVNAPVTGVLWQMAGMAAFLLLAGGLAALFTARQVERPLRTLSDQVTGANNKVSELSGQLLALQEEERQRIARELHDSTAQHLVAANLGLSGLEAEVRQSPAARKTCAEIEGLLTEALRELRIFTYLLHPPNLAKDGLQATLREFAEGFAGRTGLVARIRIPEEVDDLRRSSSVRSCGWCRRRSPTSIGTPVPRTCRSMPGSCPDRLVVRIRDDGHGMAGPARPDGPIRLGVGIAGMRARLEQFGGDLRIRTGRRAPASSLWSRSPVPGRASTPCRTLRTPWLSGRSQGGRRGPLLKISGSAARSFRVSRR